MQVDVGVYELDGAEIEMKRTSLTIGPVTFYGKWEELQWLRRELADALGLVAPETQSATAATVAS